MFLIKNPPKSEHLFPHFLEFNALGKEKKKAQGVVEVGSPTVVWIRAALSFLVGKSLHSPGATGNPATCATGHEGEYVWARTFL